MNNTMQRHEHVFEGHALAIIDFRGRACLLARQVGEALGYTDPNKLALMIGQDWSEDFIEGEDFEILRGRNLKDFKNMFELPPYCGGSEPGHHGSDPAGSPIDPRTPQAMILYEPGINMVCMKTDKPAGRALRRWLASDVLPSIRLTGGYQGPTGHNGRVGSPTELAALRREDRLLRKQIQDEQRFKLQILGKLCDRARNEWKVSEDVLRPLEVAVNERILETPLAALLPVLEGARDRWLSPTIIAERLGTNSNRVGRAITALGLKDDKDVSEARLNKAPHSDRTVTSYYYDPAVVPRISAWLQENPTQAERKARDTVEHQEPTQPQA